MSDLRHRWCGPRRGCGLIRRGPGRFRKREESVRRPPVRRLVFELGSCVADTLHFSMLLRRAYGASPQLTLATNCSPENWTSAADTIRLIQFAI
jgi:hypothetical protein